MNFWIVASVVWAILGIIAGIAIAILPKSKTGLSLAILSLMTLALWGWDMMMYLNNGGTPTDENRTISTYLDTYSINNRRDTQNIGMTAAMISGICAAIVKSLRRKMSGQQGGGAYPPPAARLLHGKSRATGSGSAHP